MKPYRMTLRAYSIFRECDGYWRAVRTVYGVRRNIAPPNCRTKLEAVRAAREDRDQLNKYSPDTSYVD